MLRKRKPSPKHDQSGKKKKDMQKIREFSIKVKKYASLLTRTVISFMNSLVEEEE